MENAYHGGRPPEVIPYETAIANAGRLKALADAECDHLAMTQGTRAVAEAAYRPGGPTVEEIEALYIRLRETSRERPPGRSSHDLGGTRPGSGGTAPAGHA